MDVCTVCVYSVFALLSPFRKTRIKIHISTIHLFFYVSRKWFHVARMGEKRNAYRILLGKLEGKRPLGRPRRRWVDNIKIDLRETEWDGINWIDLAQDRDQWRALVNTLMNFRVP
jgi:hypothetical protein